MTPSMSQSARQPPLERTIFYMVTFFHAAFFLFLCLDQWMSPSVVQPQPAHFVVKTVELDPKKATPTTAHSRSLPAPAPEPETPKVTEPKPAKANTETQAAKPPVAKEEAKQKKQAAPAEKRVETKEKASSEKKSEVVKKTPAKPVKKESQAKSKPTPALNQQEAKRREELLKQAQQNIDKMSATKTTEKAHLAQKASPLVLTPIGKLEIDAQTPPGTAQGSEQQEKGYVNELVGRLKLLLKLPDYGNVRIQLTLSRAGRVLKVHVLGAESAANRAYIEKMLPTLVFPSFGDHFGREEQHVFQITLSNE